jgi:group II intron reverse transcriptase/maturase
MTKPFNIPKKLVWEAYLRVKENKGAAGIDQQSLNDFEQNLKNNLYKLWNRLSSGSYIPSSTRAVAIPKKSGGERTLGIPTVTDRIAQMVVKLKLEPEVDSSFIDDSYGYRPKRSAIDAIEVTRKRCWQYDWVLEYDIKSLFDTIPHDLLMKAVEKHTQCSWVILYIKRWLNAPIQGLDNQQHERTCGTPQGGVISPLLANLFLHYAIDYWLKRNHPDLPSCRYADDGLVHCRTEQQAKQVLRDLGERLENCGLELHPDKTKVIYCKDGRRRKSYENTAFTFLGYTFKPRMVCNAKTKHRFVSFTPAVSKEAQKAMRKKVREARWRWRTEIEIADIAKCSNPILYGWINYYGKFCKSELNSVWRHFNRILIKWALRKYKRLKGHKTQASRYLQRLSKDKPTLFAHWASGIKGAFA